MENVHFYFPLFEHFYIDIYTYEQLVISLVNMFGKEFVIEQTGSNRIKFVQLDLPVENSLEME